MPTSESLALKYPDGQDSSEFPEQNSSGGATQVRVSCPQVLRCPLLLTVETSGDQILVSDELLRVYGVGDDIESAAQDLLEMLLDYHAELTSEQARLSDSLRRHLEVINYYLGLRG